MHPSHAIERWVVSQRTKQNRQPIHWQTDVTGSPACTRLADKELRGFKLERLDVHWIETIFEIVRVAIVDSDEHLSRPRS